MSEEHEITVEDILKEKKVVPLFLKVKASKKLEDEVQAELSQEDPEEKKED